MATLKFIGATQQVTGSCYLVETSAGRVLLECGMYQGGREADKLNKKSFPFKVKDIDAVVISHAHLDHSGLLPKLVRAGYGGQIFVTSATYDLMELMLKDAAYLEQKDTDWENKRRQRAGQKPVEPLYTTRDVDRVLEQRRAVEYDNRITVIGGVELCYRDAGHIIGSSIVELWIEEKGQTKKLVFSGDLGNSFSPLLRDPAVIESADVLLLESTYGDRDHRSHDETLEEFKQALDTAAEEGGNVLIPAFAVGRTQDIVYRLGQYYQDGSLKQKAIFLDSPMAIAASEIYVNHAHLFNFEDPHFRTLVPQGWEKWLPVLRNTRKTEESMAINNITGGAIIIAGSGMCNGGRIRHHFKNNLWREKAHIIISGYQARGTPGRALVDGAKFLNILGNKIAVKAQVHTLGGFSAHAGQSQLIDWVTQFKSPRPRLFLVHGEVDKMLLLKEKIGAELGWQAHIPHVGEQIEII